MKVTPLKKKKSPLEQLANVSKGLGAISFKRLIPAKKTFHTKNIEGEALPDEQKRWDRKRLLLFSLISSVPLFILTYLTNMVMQVIQCVTDKRYTVLLEASNYLNVSWFWLPPFSLVKTALFYCAILCVMTLYLYKKWEYNRPELAFGQKGDSRFTTITELLAQYKAIPLKSKPFKGYGGVPISYYKGKYLIDTDTVNSIFLGVSRSGKGEMAVVTLIDNLSRAENKSSIVVNDPKGELFTASKETLEKRGYNVMCLNVLEPLESMSYNPLQLIIEAYQKGDEQESAKRCNTFTSMLFAKGMGGDNEFFYSSAKSAVNAIIMTITQKSCEEGTPEKITMYNVAQMLNELGSYNFVVGQKEVNALDEYFNTLPQGNIAKLQYGATSFAGDKAKGSILATASQCIDMFTSEMFGKMTSKMSIDLKQVGFPKSLEFQFEDYLVGQRATVSFMTTENKVIAQYILKIKAKGICILNFKDTLKSGFKLTVSVPYFKVYSENGQTYRKRTSDLVGHEYVLKFKADHEKETEYDTQVKLLHQKPLVFETNKEQHPTEKYLKKDDFVLNYNEKPSAVFMIVPDYDTSNHIICSVFIKQLYTELAKNCSETKDKKCDKRVHFILDEVGNMPEIAELDNIMTVCLGRNMLFNLFIQSYSQLNKIYGDSSETIKENCQNHVFIVSTNSDTIEEFSKKCGYKTVNSTSTNEKQYSLDTGVSRSADQERIITPERLSQLIPGETVVLRALHRNALNGNKVRPFPIFNTMETNLPYRYQFLSEDFDTTRDLNELDISSIHANFSLKKNQIDYSDFILNKKAKTVYIQRQSQSTEEILVATEETEDVTMEKVVALLKETLKVIEVYKRHENIQSDTLETILQAIRDDLRKKHVSQLNLRRIGQWLQTNNAEERLVFSIEALQIQYEKINS